MLPKRRLLVCLAVGLLLGGCGAQGSEPPLPTAVVTAARPAPTSAPSPSPASTLAPIPTIVPTVPSTSAPAEGVTVPPLPLAKEPPAGVASWQRYRGSVSAKGFAFTYEFLYPPAWFAYPQEEGGVHIQSIPRSETPGDLPAGSVKIEVGANACLVPADCQTTGHPLVLAGLAGVDHAYYDDTFDTTIHEVVLRKGDAVFRLTMYIVGGAAEMADTPSILGYLLSTLVIE